MSKLLEAKAVLEWSKEKLDKDKGAMITFPEQYAISIERKNNAQKVYDILCEDWLSAMGKSTIFRTPTTTTK